MKGVHRRGRGRRGRRENEYSISKSHIIRSRISNNYILHPPLLFIAAQLLATFTLKAMGDYRILMAAQE
jgi:hypothetical protein